MKKEERPLYFNASVLVGDKLYFTAYNSSWLYVLDMDSGEISPVIQLPCQTVDLAKFSSLIFYSGEIWMIPWHECDVMVYDIERETVVRLPIPFSINERDKFRKVIHQEHILWLLPVFKKFIVKIDMEQISCEIYGKWAENLDFDENISTSFKCMYKANNDLYLFADSCKNNLIFNTETHQIRTWGEESYHTFGVVHGENVYLSPANNFDCLRFFSIPDAGEKKMMKMNQIKLPKHIWEDIDIYAYWYGEAIGEKIYFLPHSANSLLILDNLSNELQVIPLSSENYQTPRTYKGFAGYEVMSYAEGGVITPYEGNKILMEIGGQIAKEYLLKRPAEEIEMSKYNDAQRVVDAVSEKGMISWSKVISDIEEQTEKNRADQQGKIGQTIYQTLMERKV